VTPEPEPREPLSPTHSGPNARRFANLFIALFLAFHVAMPLRYYLGDRGYDERFSWRMFSTLRLQECQMRVAEAEQEGPNPPFREVQVRRDVQAAWVNLLDRVRMPVVEKYLVRRCERQGVTQVRYARRCTDTDGTQLPAQTLLMDCGTRQVRAEAGAPL
jgi:hypothetical protein